MREQTAYSNHGEIVCRYTDKGTRLLFYSMALVLGGAVIHFVYANEFAREALDSLSQTRDERNILLNGFSLLWAAFFADFLLLVRAFFQDRPAIIITHEGVSGLHGGLWREIAWADLYEIDVTDRYIRFVRGPKNTLSKFIFGLQAPGSKRFHLGEYCIHVLRMQCDRSTTDVLHTVRKYRPELL